MSRTKKCLFVSFLLVVTVCTLALPTFAASIDGEQLYAYVVRTPNTMVGFNLGNSSFPVVDVMLGVQAVGSDGVMIKLFSAGFEDDFGSSANSVNVPLTTDSDGVTAPVFTTIPSDFSAQWTPTLYDGRYWVVRGINGQQIISYNPTGYLDDTRNGRFWFKCWTTATAVFSSTIKSVDLVYQPPQWSATSGEVLLSPDSSINGNNPAYFEALKKTGYYRMILHCVGENGEKYDVNLEWIAFAGEFANTMSSFLSQTISPDVNSGAAYDAGYNAGYTSGRNSMQESVERSYQSGYAAGFAASDGSEGLISSALLAIGEIPFTMLFQITDLDILGLNLGSLVSMAITGAALVFIIKTFLI